MINFELDESSHKLRLDKALAIRLPEISRARITSALKSGEILVNDKVISPSSKAASGMRIAVKLAPELSEDEPEDIPLDIIYQDEDVIVINKPIGLTVHPGAGAPNGTLLNALLFHFPELKSLPRAGIVHRLDKDTSGVMVVARSLRAHTSLTQQLQARTMKREYLALVHGEVISGFTVDNPIGRCPRNRLKMTVGIGKPAVTHVRIQERFHKMTLLKVSLETGRTHQIRVHLSHAGHPIVGDQVYNNRGFVKGYPPSLLADFKRQALHAYQLTFTHPSGKPLAFKARLSADLKALLATIRDHEVNQQPTISIWEHAENEFFEAEF